MAIYLARNSTWYETLVLPSDDLVFSDYGGTGTLPRVLALDTNDHTGQTFTNINFGNTTAPSKIFTTTGPITSWRSRLRGLYIAPGSSAGRVTITDGPGGAVLLDIDPPATKTTHIVCNILAINGLELETMTNVFSVTAFCK